jgi:hypothetical protein
MCSFFGLSPYYGECKCVPFVGYFLILVSAELSFFAWLFDGDTRVAPPPAF